MFSDIPLIILVSILALGLMALLEPFHLPSRTKSTEHSEPDNNSSNERGDI